MAVSLVIGPTGHNPSVARDEYQYAAIKDAQTAVLVAAGAGLLRSVMVGAAGTRAKFYDVASGGTADATTEIANVPTATAGQVTKLDIAFSKGLTCVTTGTGTEITVTFRGAATLSPRTFGAPGSAG